MMIHDSIWIESPGEETREAMAISREVMTAVVDLAGGKRGHSTFLPRFVGFSGVAA